MNNRQIQLMSDASYLFVGAFFGALNYALGGTARVVFWVILMAVFTAWRVRRVGT